ncbi:hypothetical protein G7K_6484-t1 [Saitoella complicata NRRL Y-17804]|uniref:Zn(2)-C6 fungal-type domain-containing protein n=1 Tax=Saitoella complicata (strain BCRC 22490 / CBS 7301 / JCM 7358 / NBRC 10748 / NRRL Y-17804) TaxID=698492 RepID=A0A0E9NRW0_SAICN|nr:hypothetical protein G7K_6484-t1 [Saitoella complicata NRRL Y-17804]
MLSSLNTSGKRSRSGTGSETSPAPSTKRHRSRPTNVCLPCHARKTKCDRARPACDQCVKRGLPSVCEYEVEDVSGLVGNGTCNRVVEGSMEASGSLTVEERLKRLERFMENQLAADGIAPGNTNDHTTHPPTLTRPPSPRPQPTNVQRPLPPTAVNPSFAASFLHDPKGFPFPALWNGYLVGTQISDLIRILPSSAEVRDLLEVYKMEIDPLYHVVDLPRFEDEWKRFEVLGEAEKAGVNSGWLAVAFSIFSLASLFSPAPKIEKPQQPRLTAAIYASASWQSLRASSFLSLPTPSLNVMTALALTISYLLHENRVQEGEALMGSVLRLARRVEGGLGLAHRKPGQGKRRGDGSATAEGETGDTEEMRRVIRLLVYQDSFLSSVLDADFTPIPALDALNMDKDLTTKHGRDDAFDVALMRLGKLMREIRACSPTDEAKARQLHDSLKRFSWALPEEFKIKEAINTTWVLDPEYIAEKSDRRLAMQTAVLALLRCSLQISLHAPFLPRPDPSDFEHTWHEKEYLTAIYDTVELIRALVPKFGAHAQVSWTVSYYTFNAALAVLTFAAARDDELGFMSTKSAKLNWIVDFLESIRGTSPVAEKGVDVVRERWKAAFTILSAKGESSISRPHRQNGNSRIPDPCLPSNDTIPYFKLNPKYEKHTRMPHLTHLPALYRSTPTYPIQPSSKTPHG